MRRFIVLSLFIVHYSLFISEAQVARWMILPIHQSVEKPAGIDVFVCHDGDTTSIFTLQGQLIGTSTDEVNDFQEDKAVTVRRGTHTITGFFTADGRYVNLDPCEVYRDYPFFSAGYLLVQKDKNYFYIDGDGKFWKHGEINLPARIKAPPIPTYITRLQIYAGDDGKLGIFYDGKEIVTPQFDEVQRAMTDLAMVRIGDRWGVIGVDSLTTFRPLLNGGDEIWFRHQTQRSTISIQVPDYMDASKVTLKMDDNADDCRIDETSRIINGSVISYVCELSLPSTMLNDSIGVSYDVCIVYDGIRMQLLPVTACLRYEAGRFNVDDLSDGAFEGAGYTFTINIKDQAAESADGAYPYEVEVMTGSLPSTLTKLSQSKYRCHLHTLHRDNNNVYVVVREKGCPPTIFPFEITIKRPAAKTASRGLVTIRKKQVTKDTPKKLIKLL